MLIKLVNTNLKRKLPDFLQTRLNFLRKIQSNYNDCKLLICSFICFQSVQANQILPGKSVLAF
jgi:hypothetical protein